ncbi:MAG: hypothetical protein M3Q07_16330 [Pseudobdellovibrionaceae bacterium]|nr:hypothetical protein [Pseudobdellovibrionaceae bacterium]
MRNQNRILLSLILLLPAACHKRSKIDAGQDPVPTAQPGVTEILRPETPATPVASADWKDGSPSMLVGNWASSLFQDQRCTAFYTFAEPASAELNLICLNAEKKRFEREYRRYTVAQYAGTQQVRFKPKESSCPSTDGRNIKSEGAAFNADLLTGLPASLTTLKITGSKLRSSAFVSSLVNLKVLDLTGNQIQDFTRVTDLKKLTTVLAAGNPAANKVCGTPAAAVCEYDLITKPATVEEYCINYVFQESGKVYAAAIEALSVSQAIAAPKTAGECSDLNSKLRLKRKLELTGTGGTGTSDIRPITAIRSLNHLALRNFGMIDVKPLADLINLDVLDLTENRIIDPKPLEVLPELVELNLTQNMIVSMNNFSHPKLKRLILNGNRMTSLESLGDMPDLRMLSLANIPGFKDVTGASKFGKLKNLNVGKTAVTDLQTLEPSVGLEIDAPEAVVKNGCPVLLGSCLTDGATAVAQSGPVPGLKPGQRVQNNPAAEVHLPGMIMSVKLQ